ncbi:Phage tail tape-measure protein, controls tail length [Vreelandella subterranea]|uniref:Phage tail tape-measure protein, controls tail length n=1 Tax=Vreelandella subterranea TaxID=416874 RepID=A0A1H9W3E0_9GAMM|nr:hypothetical protein [Halomonas subterranea]SES28023.1 Phage tail tape-measure protein, controls tail length [Halomonas subterranea]
MSELRASVVMDLRGNLERQSRRYEGAMRNMANNGQRHMTRLQRVTGGVGRQLDRVGNRWVALATGAAGFGTVRNLVNLEERFTRLGIQSQRSAEDMEALRQQIFETAREPDIRVDPSQITGAIEAIVEKTGDLEFAQENIRNIAAAISATGAEGTNIGEILAEFQKMDIRGMDEVLQSIDTLNVQGKEGAFTLQNLASLGPRVVTAYTALGRQGPEAIREMGAALQVIRQGTGSSEQAATAFEALLRTFQDAEKAKDLASKSGVQIFDADELERGREVLRPINELMVEIVEAADGRTSRLSEIFDAEAMRAFNAALGEYNRNGTVESMDRFFQVQGDGTTTMGDSARAAETAAGAMRNLSSAWQDFADTNLSEHIQAAADALNSLDPETVDLWLKVAGGVAGATAALYAGRSLMKLGSFYGGMGRRSTSGGIAGGLGAASSMAPVPVFVTNLGALGGGGSPGRTGGTRKGGGYTPPTTRTGGSTSAPTTSQKPRLSSQALSAASRVGNSSAVAVGRSLPAISTVLAAQGIGGLIEDAVERTETGGKMGNYVELARESAKQTVMEYGRNSVDTFRDAGESVLRIFVDQDGRVKDARAERGQGGPEIDVDLGNWRTWQ